MRQRAEQRGGREPRRKSRRKWWIHGRFPCRFFSRRWGARRFGGDRLARRGFVAVGGSSSGSSLTGAYTLPGNAKLSDAHHTYAIEVYALRDPDAAARDRTDLESVGG